MNSLESYKSLDSWTSFLAKGKDAKRFLNGQLTNDVSKLSDNEFQLTSRVSRTGQLTHYGYLLRISEEIFKMITPVNLCDSFIADLNKFLIMDDLELEKGNEPISISFNNEDILKSEFRLKFLGEPAGLKFIDSNESIDEKYLDERSFLFGLPRMKRFTESTVLVNQTVLIEEAVSNSKGCYVGQETVKKIESNRGAGKKDTCLKIINSDSLDEILHVKVGEDSYEVIESLNVGYDTYLLIEAKRGLRVENKKIEVEINNKALKAEVKSFPLSSKSLADLAMETYEKGISHFTQDEDEIAKEYLYKAYQLDGSNPEIIEALGALEGRLGNLKEAIQLMDELEKVDPKTVMAHTNKSLFYMRLGEIEKAEDEKSKATVKSFENVAQQNNNKKDELLKRLDMYRQVIEIDEEDEMANQGSAHIYFELEEFDKSLPFLEKLLSMNSSNYKALSLKGKVLMRTGQEAQAKALLLKASDLAGEKGDFLVANEMQSLINSLETSSSL